MANKKRHNSSPASVCIQREYYDVVVEIAEANDRTIASQLRRIIFEYAVEHGYYEKIDEHIS